MRIAVCISGQLRAFKQCFESQNINLFEPNKVDIFVCTDKDWQDSESEILECYEPYIKGITYFSSSRDEFGRAARNHKGLRERYKKAEKCHNLLRKYEETHGKYDAIVFMRPDLCFDNPIKVSEFDISDDIIYVFGGLYRKDSFLMKSVFDGFALTSSDGMDSLISLSEDYGKYRAVAKSSVYGFKGGRSPEAQFIMHLHTKGIKVKPMGPLYEFYILRDGTTGKSKDKLGYQWRPKPGLWEIYPEEILPDLSSIITQKIHSSLILPSD